MSMLPGGPERPHVQESMLTFTDSSTGPAIAAEPASVLLERIKAEREGEGGKRGGGRKQMRRQRGRTGSAA